MTPEERAAIREEAAQRIMVQQGVTHEVAVARLTALAMSAGFRTATDEELHEQFVKAGWREQEPSRAGSTSSDTRRES